MHALLASSTRRHHDAFIICILLATSVATHKETPNFDELLAKYELTRVQIRLLASNSYRSRLVVTFNAFGTDYSIPMTSTSLPLEQNFDLVNADGHPLDRSQVIDGTEIYVGDGEHAYSKIFLSTNNEPPAIHGYIELEDDILILEPYSDGLSLVYRNSDIRHNASKASATVDYYPNKLQGFSVPKESVLERYLPRKRNAESIRKTRCELKIVADYDFYRIIGNGNYANAARYLVNLIERVNGIFTRVDWGLDMNNRRLMGLGFAIKEIKIYDKPTASPITHFNAGTGQHVSAFDMLRSFSVEEGTGAVCLSVLISAKIFDMGILGVANIGYPDERGICAKQPINGSMYLNTAVISVQRRTGLMITRVVDLVVAHELGHAWGGFHDDMDDPECVPPGSQDGRYIMHESSNSGYDRNNYRFSPCSIRLIHRVLYGLAERCFAEEQAALCGNGILEVGEECDSGGRLATGTSKEDPCCTSRCRLKSHARCSPRHSECCSGNCTYLSRSHMCQRKNTDTCKGAAYCTGKTANCPDAQPVEDGEECVEEGQCRSGRCVPFCQLLSTDWSPCICENVTESCLRCCRSLQTGECRPVVPSRYLEEGAMCIHGQCHRNVCEKELTDTASRFLRILKNFRDTPNSKVFADYFVFVIIFATLILWCPCGLFIVYKDRQRQNAVVEQAQNVDVVKVPVVKRVRRTPT